MKYALRIAIMSLALTAIGCGGDDGGSTPADAGRKDGGAKVDGGGTTCDTVMCGTTCCQANETCNATTNTCVAACTPSCSGKTCGQDDGCGTKCTTCPTGQTCSTTTWTCGTTTCTPSCTGKTCGEADGCGGKCTSCPTGQTCNQTTWTCGTTCTPNCTGKTCGADDGCGSKCVGTCPTGQTCNPTTFACGTTCTPSCNGATCGAADGCGGKCVGTCPTGQSCDATTYVCGTASTCTINASLGTVPNITGDTETDDATAPSYFWLVGNANTDATPDVVWIELLKYGRWVNGFQTGTFQLTGDDLNYETCAACILLLGDYDEATGDGTPYMATGGTLTLTSVSGRLVGTLTNATFEHVTIASGTYHSTPVNDGCTSSVASVGFDSAIVEAAP